MSFKTIVGWGRPRSVVGWTGWAFALFLVAFVALPFWKGLYFTSQWACAFWALAAAVLWFGSALVRIPENFHGVAINTGEATVVASRGLRELGPALRRQSEWSAAAAICAGLAAFLQVVAMFAVTH